MPQNRSESPLASGAGDRPELACAPIDCAGAVRFDARVTPERSDTRKLAAILSADVVGYSRLMAEDEAETVRAITSCREEVERRVPRSHGRLVDFTGDNFLAEFPTATDAAGCALEIQSAMAARAEAQPPARRMALRMGLHLGEVRVEGERIFGSGVNIAARLAQLAEPGGLCVSAVVRDQLRGEAGLAFQSLGPQTLKNIPDPVEAFRAVWAEVGGRGRAAGGAARRARAVRRRAALRQHEHRPRSGVLRRRHRRGTDQRACARRGPARDRAH
jgi:class 3 adenylate cyclase